MTPKQTASRVLREATIRGCRCYENTSHATGKSLNDLVDAGIDTLRLFLIEPDTKHVSHTDMTIALGPLSPGALQSQGKQPAEVTRAPVTIECLPDGGRSCRRPSDLERRRRAMPPTCLPRRGNAKECQSTASTTPKPWPRAD
jgi:hypothetical protein